MSGKRSRTKGHSFERSVAIALRRIFPDAKRHLEYQCDEALGIDIDNTGPYRIQCKRGKRYSSLSAIKEPVIDPIEPGIPVLITKADNQEALVALPLEHFLELLSYRYT